MPFDRSSGENGRGVQMTDTSYAGKTADYFEDRRDEMLPFIPIGARHVLEVGCGNAAFAAHLKTQRRVEVTAIEAHPAAADVAHDRVDRLLSSSIEDALPKLAGEHFDCIVLNDVLEHLVDPWDVLTRLRHFLAPDGVVVASIPNIRYHPVFKEFVLQGRWQYRQDGVMDRTHLRFFTRQSMQELFVSTGYAMRRIEGINAISLPWKFSLLNQLCGQALADTRFKQFACVAGLVGNDASPRL
jgi:2-polyprenyl-3-methyl-5-hydroxy-6-metoxy-1,4-benzoquinol methylase